LSALASALLVPRPLQAQVAGATLSGTVTDASGALIPNAQISIKNAATGVITSATADSAGFYSAPNLLPGTYEVTVTASGFASEVQTGVTLAVGAQQELKFTLETHLVMTRFGVQNPTNA
jgi:hypothetical protein